MSSDFTMTDAERKEIRSAITSHASWPELRKALGIDSSALGAGMCWQLAHAINLDVRSTLNNGTMTMAKLFDDNKTAFADLNRMLGGLGEYLTPKDYNFATTIVRTVLTQQDGNPSTKQLGIVRDTVAKGQAARDRGETPKAETPKTETPKAETPKAAPLSAGNASADPAGAAIAAMVAPHLMDSLTASVAHLVEAKLAGFSSIRIEIGRQDGSTLKLDGIHHPKFATLLKCCTSRQASGYVPNIWIWGPASSGKTHAAEQIAEALGLEFYMQGACSMSHELVGYQDAGGRYITTTFRQAFEFGGVMLCDELDGWDANAVLCIQAALANGRAAFPDGMIKRHKDCIIIGAANTTGSGATLEYNGRNKLDSAFLSRFPIKIDWPLDVAIEQATSGSEAFAKRVQAARARALAAGVKHMIDARHSAAGAALIAAGFTSDEAAELTYLAGLDPAQIRQVEGR